MTQPLLVQADSVQIPLKDKSIHMVCTSPPYYGLRDYGTAQWQGGNPGCTHRKGEMVAHDPRSTLVGTTMLQNHSQESWGDACRKCGAVRIDQQLGLEPLHDCNGAFTGQNCGSCYICHMRVVFQEVWRVLRDNGTLWLNIGDSYSTHAAGKIADPMAKSTLAGVKSQLEGRKASQHNGKYRTIPTIPEKNLMGIPWRLALALQADGWYLRSEIIWDKVNPMPESVQDRPTKAHEQVFLLTKQERYFYDAEAIREPVDLAYLSAKWGNSLRRTGANGLTTIDRSLPTGAATTCGVPSTGRNCRSVWHIPSEPFSGAHFACFPTALAERCILAGTSAAGCCPQCATPWHRETRRETGIPPSFNGSSFTKGKTLEARAPLASVGQRARTIVRETIGWAPVCACDAGAPVPAIVFDPFCGSATTLLVARALGRHAIGLDLSWPYLYTIARERLGFAALAQWEGQSQLPRPLSLDGLPLFTQGGMP